MCTLPSRVSKFLCICTKSPERFLKCYMIFTHHNELELINAMLILQDSEKKRWNSI